MDMDIYFSKAKREDDFLKKKKKKKCVTIDSREMWVGEKNQNKKNCLQNYQNIKSILCKVKFQRYR